MSYATEDQAVEANPVEMYKFTGPSTTYLYTSSRVQQSYAGDDYTPLAISRGEVSIGDLTEGDHSLVVKVPTSALVVQDYFPIPVRTLTLDLFRRHGVSANVQKIWSGPVLEFAPNGIATELRLASPASLAMEQPLPRVRYQAQCPHDFGDSLCGINLATFTTSTTVSAISSDGKDITVASVGTDTLLGGELVHTPSGERRMILAVVGSVVSVDLPFPSISVSDAIDLIAGCDRTITTCRDEYDNVGEFMGFPNIPTRDIQQVPLRSL